MGSWRDTTSATAQSELDDLLNTVLPLAQQHLAKYGELLPFGAAKACDGSVDLLAVDAGRPVSPNVEMLHRLRTVARAAVSENRAVAFVAAAAVGGADALRIELEHCEGVAIVVIAPYRRGMITRRVRFRELRGTAALPQVWTSARVAGSIAERPTRVR